MFFVIPMNAALLLDLVAPQTKKRSQFQAENSLFLLHIWGKLCVNVSGSENFAFGDRCRDIIAKVNSCCHLVVKRGKNAKGIYVLSLAMEYIPYLSRHLLAFLVPDNDTNEKIQLILRSMHKFVSLISSKHLNPFRKIQNLFSSLE